MTTPDEPKTRGRKPKQKHVPGIFLREFDKKVKIKLPDGTTEERIYHYKGEILQICYNAPDPKTGKLKMMFESARTKNRRKAEDFLAQRRREVELKINPHALVSSDMTLTSYIDDKYLHDDEILELRGLNKKILVLNSVKKYLGRYKLNDLTAPMVKDYIDKKKHERKRVLIELAEKKKLKDKDFDYDEDELKPLSQATKNRHIATIKAVYQHGYEAGVVSETAMTEMRRLSKGAENNERIRYLTSSEIPVLIEKCKEHSEHLRQIVECALTTGLRAGRIYKLEWNHIDMEHKQLRIPKDKNGSKHFVPIGSAAMSVLKEREAVKRHGCKWVFFNPFDNDRWYDLKEGFNMSVERAGIYDFHFHDLRHTFISHLVMADVSIAKVQELAGHRTIAMTMRYSHLAPDNLAVAIEKLPYLLPKSC